jgi:serine beta-lactamase-like protein LACTB, mitochondrial
MNALILYAGLALGAGTAWDAETRAELVREEIRRRQLPGLAAAVVRDGAVVWSGAFGLADIENETPVRERTVFRFASVSKPVTAVAALRLVDAGRFSLDQAISTLVGTLPAEMAPVTIRHLLAHQSGLRHYQPDGREPLTHYARLSEAVRSRSGDRLLFDPGTRFAYSTHGYSLLGWVMEAATGRAFAEEMRARVFAPANMASARTDDVYAIVPHRARGYFRSLSGEIRNARPIDSSDKLPGGGLCGTILDLAAFAAALQDDRLLSLRARHAMWTPQRLADGSATEYGLGWHIGQADGHRFVFHGGSQPGTSALLYLEPDAAIGAVVLSNLEHVDFLSLARRLIRSGEPPKP